MWWQALAGIVKPVTDLIDNLHTSDEEKGKLRIAILATQVQMGEKLLDYEKQRMEMQSKIIQSEATSESALTRMWRPITMLTFLGMTVAYWLGYTPPNVSEAVLMEVFGLIKLGLGGYVVGRSAEKVVPQVAKMFKSEVTGK